ncbi:MAG: hypothetical protein KDB23_03105, partial [Planctomycetales bacterium]|nr:hypothetical protein [Planctomycetales bacterium]
EGESIRAQLAIDAEQHFRQIVELRPNDPTAQAMLADAVYRVGAMSLRMGSHQDAAKRLSEAQEQWRSIFEESPGHTDIQYRLTKACDKLGLTQQRLGEFEESLQSIQMAVQLAEDLVRRFPEDAVFRDKLADVYDHLRGLRDAMGPFSEKRKAISSVKIQLEHLVKMQPEHTGYRRRLAETYRRLGSLERASGPGHYLFSHRKVDVSLYDDKLLEQARAIQQELVDAKQELPWVAVDLSDTLNALANLWFHTANDGTYREFDARSYEIVETILHDYPDVEKLHLTLAQRLVDSAKRDMSRHEIALALSSFLKAAEHYRHYLSKRPQSLDIRIDLTAALILAGRCSAAIESETDSNDHIAAARNELNNIKETDSCPAHLQESITQLERALDQSELTE